MKKINVFVIILTICFSVSCKENKKESEPEVIQEEAVIEKTYHSKELVVKLEPKSESNVSGNVFFNEQNGLVTMTAVMNGLTEGTHAIHIHEKSDCSSPDGTSAGGHWNPTGQPHGKWKSPEGFHKGDIGNFEVGADGKGTITMLTDEWCIGCGDPNKDIIGKGIIVHAVADDFVTQPTGNAGGRVSCGGVIQ